MVQRTGHGMIFMVRDRSHAWRERILYKEHGKVVVLLGSNHH
jgi:hypothetical protein